MANSVFNREGNWPRPIISQAKAQDRVWVDPPDPASPEVRRFRELNDLTRAKVLAWPCFAGSEAKYAKFRRGGDHDRG